MTLDDLAAAVVGAEPGDLTGLAHIHQALEDLRGADALSDAAATLIADGLRCVEKIILGECGDATSALADLGNTVSMLQHAVERGATPAVPAIPKPTAQAGDSPAEKPPAASPDSEQIADPALLAEFVAESRDHLENAEAALLDLESNPGNTEGINLIFRAFHTIKGTSGFLALKRINAVAHKAETLLDRVRKGEIVLSGRYADLALESADALKRLVEQVTAQPGAPSSESDGIDALLARLDSPDDAGRAPAAQARAEESVCQSSGDRPCEVPPPDSSLKKVPPPGPNASARQTGAAADPEATLRVSMARLDKLIDMVGELVIAQSMVSQDAAVRHADGQGLARKVAHSDKITRELQDLTLSMRMVPLKATFQKMARLIRDLARKSGKQVRFVTEGEDTEIDRNMVDAINDPLVHMMRNAADHGVESPDERIRQGKPAEGLIVLRATQAAGKVVIEIQDDGRGIDPDKIMAKAVERGLVEAGRALSQNDIFDLLFAPGFSTAEKVTDVSGRGVGMDVVKRNIEGLRGRIEVASTRGAGSTFTIRLPLTLGIIDGMLLKVGRETYILPTLNIEQALRPDGGAISTVQNQGEMLLLRGQLVPIFRLHRLLQTPGACEEATGALLVVVEHQGQRCALLADALLGQQQVVIKSLGSGLGEIAGVSGAAILGDGRVGLILDVGGIMQLARDGGNAAIRPLGDLPAADAHVIGVQMP